MSWKFFDQCGPVWYHGEHEPEHESEQDPEPEQEVVKQTIASLETIETIKIPEKVNDNDEDDEDEEVCEMEINGVNYYVSDEVNGLIYKIEKDGEIGRCVGKILNGLPIFK